MSALEPGYHIRAAGGVLHGVKGEPVRWRRSATSDRVLWGHLVPVGTAALITPRRGGPAFYETWTANALYLSRSGKGAGVYIGEHRGEGGTRVGHVGHLAHGRAWTDAALLIDDGPAGDAVLADIGPDGGHLPLSIGFLADPGRSVTSNLGPVPEVLRQRAMLTEVAIVGRAAFDGSYTYARGSLEGLVQAQSGL